MKTFPDRTRYGALILIVEINLATKSRKNILIRLSLSIRPVMIQKRSPKKQPKASNMDLSFVYNLIQNEG